MVATLGFSRAFSDPFSLGGLATTAVPSRFDVAVNGRPYMLDRTFLSQFPMISTIRATRAQSDQSQEPGEQSLTPDDLWRRAQDSWHLGAGQAWLDQADSNREQYRTSKGADIWTEGQISLLNATTESLNSANTNLKLMPAGSRLYAVDGTALKYTTDLTNWTTVTGTSGSSITGIASDGYTVWVTDGADVYSTNTGTGAASSWSTEDADVLGYVKGRLMFSDGPELGYFSDIATPTATALFTHASSAFAWVGFAEGPGHIYTAGYAGDKSLIYRIALVPEGTALGAPTVAGELPDGEIIHSIDSYLGFIFLGTSEGVRFCTIDNNGDLTVGELIETANAVKCFEGQGPHVWFGNTNYDSTSTGLGRLNLRDFSDIEALKPAYASDLMVTAQATILDVCTFSSKRVFAVSGDGIYKEDTANLVASAVIDSGVLRFGITEQKIPRYVDVALGNGFDGSVKCEYAVNGSTSWTTAGTHSGSETNYTFTLTENPVESIEIRLTLTPGSNDVVLQRYTLRALPVPGMRRKITLPLLLADTVHDANDRPMEMDVGFEVSTLDGLRISKDVIAVQVGAEAYSCVLDDYDFIATHPTRRRAYWNGTCVTQFKTV